MRSATGHTFALLYVLTLFACHLPPVSRLPQSFHRKLLVCLLPTVYFLSPDQRQVLRMEEEEQH